GPLETAFRRAAAVALRAEAIAEPAAEGRADDQTHRPAGDCARRGAAAEPDALELARGRVFRLGGPGGARADARGKQQQNRLPHGTLLSVPCADRTPPVERPEVAAGCRTGAARWPNNGQFWRARATIGADHGGRRAQ